jgi:hypothetical protein
LPLPFTRSGGHKTFAAAGSGFAHPPGILKGATGAMAEGRKLRGFGQPRLSVSVAAPASSHRRTGIDGSAIDIIKFLSEKLAVIL